MSSIFTRAKTNKNRKKQKGIRKLVRLREITSYGIRTYAHGDIAFFRIRPSNLSVLSPESIQARVRALMNVLKGVTEINMYCVNSRENFAENKQYLRELIEREQVAEVRWQLEKDIQFLDAQQTSMASAREFFLVIYLKDEGNSLQIPPYLSHVEQIIREQGFSVRLCEPGDMMNILGAYFEQNNQTDRLESFDGERFVVM